MDCGRLFPANGSYRGVAVEDDEVNGSRHEPHDLWGATAKIKDRLWQR